MGIWDLGFERSVVADGVSGITIVVMRGSGWRKGHNWCLMFCFNGLATV